MSLLEHFPISAWLQVADAMMRPLVYVQVPEVVEIVRQAQDVIDKKKPKEGESPIDEIVEEQNLPDMMLLSHVWDYGRDDVGKKTVSTIISTLRNRFSQRRMSPPLSYLLNSQQLAVHYISTLSE